MASGDPEAVGARVRYWRERRRLSRQQFADMVGRSTSWLDKIEKGERTLQRLPMLERVASALSVDPSVLRDANTARTAGQCPDCTEVHAIKCALGRYPTVAQSDRPPPGAHQVKRQLDYVGHAWLSSHFTTVAAALPRLLLEAQLHALSADQTDRQQAQRSLVMAYRVACSMLLKYDSTDVAWLAADRAMYAAQGADDPIALARATRSVARAMTHTGQADEAIAVSTDMADLLRPLLDTHDADALPLFGMLLLSAEITAATRGDADLATALHNEALAATRQLGPQHRGHHTIFGRANVEVHRVAALVRLHEGTQAVRYADGLAPDLINSLPSERRSNFLLDLTDAYTQTGHYRAAIDMLRQAEGLAPQEVRCRPLAHRLIIGLLSTAPGGSDPILHQIAHRAGVTA